MGEVRCGVIRDGVQCWTLMTQTGWECPVCKNEPPLAASGPEASDRAEKMVSLMEIMKDRWFTPEFKLNRIMERLGYGPPMAKPPELGEP